MDCLNASDLLERCAAAGVPLRLDERGRVVADRSPPADMAAQVRQQRDAIVEELRRRAGGVTAPVATRPPPAGEPAALDAAREAAGELAACDREADLLRRVETRLGAETYATLWNIIDRLLERRDLATANALWLLVVDALDRGILSRLVGWLRSLDRAGTDVVELRRLVSSGPGMHDYHCGRARRQA